jgi:D-alanyl-D-alanine carboxypeptidase (penicillin-binding protein 5/6)
VKILSLLLIPLLVFSLSAQAEPLKVSLQSPSAILFNPDTGRILYEKNAHSASLPASTIKIVTLLFLLEEKKVPLDAKVKVSQNAVGSVHASVKQADFSRYPSYLLEHDATIMGLKRGEVLTIEELLYGLMLVSGDDAANALAEYASGSIEKFMEEINAYLRRLGMRSTYMTNPHGLHHPQMTTTAYELAQFAAKAFRNPKVREIMQTLKFERACGATLIQRNKLILPQSPYFYPKATLAKTGYHFRAKFPLVAAAEHEGRRLISVVFGCENRDQRYKETTALFEAAFKEKKVTRPLFAKEGEIFRVKIPRAEGPVRAQLLEDLNVSYFPAEEPQLKAKLQWKKLRPPIESGQLVGCIKVLDEKERVIAVAPLHATGRIRVSSFFRLLGAVKSVGPWFLLLLFILIKPVRERLKLLKAKLLGPRL